MKPPREYELEAFAADLGDAPSIDLHGEPVHEALHALEIFLHAEAMKGASAVKVIHGRGSGALRKEIQAWLKSQKILVPYFRDSEHPSSLGAVTIVVLERLKNV